ncbi:MAG: hypothetical protein KC766_03135 [Myxococcales bacterium]|nr:hypothetical protein [Myxococcales bacterium]
MRRTRLVVAWYLKHHYGTSEDPGTRPMYYDRQRVGHLAVTPADLGQGSPAALFKVLIATAMFQRLRDALVMRLLRELPARTAREIGSMHRLAALSEASSCPHLKSNEALLTSCDLSKHPETKRGTCGEYPELPCHLKKHTEALRRYGHFGKVPTSAALALRDGGQRSLPQLYERTVASSHSAKEAAVALERALSRSWRVSQKIASMFLSAVANPDLGDSNAPWSAGVDWNHFVVIDSNVALYLETVGYQGARTYDARREFVQALASRIDLETMLPGLCSTNARLVQQALYLFMSQSNRKSLPYDCCQRQEWACPTCPSELRIMCSLRK